MFERFCVIQFRGHSQNSWQLTIDSWQLLEVDWNFRRFWDFIELLVFRDSTMYLENWTLWLWCNYEKATVKEIFSCFQLKKQEGKNTIFAKEKLLETWACIIQLYREPIGLSMSWLVLKSERSEHLVFVLFTNQKPSVSGFWFERRNDEARERITQGVSQAGFAEFASSISTKVKL